MMLVRDSLVLKRQPHYTTVFIVVLHPSDYHLSSKHAAPWGRAERATMQKNKINFILALHNHQPEGNFPYVFEQNFQIAYQPL